ncbi:MAG TPA: tetratricopeptide repeat protein [Streptosporangiaceae bacterium]|nr:tetratricopeptide repeat protein [Streptosporangiaceae bacterium]
MSQPTSAMHRSILCVDVENFGDRRRTDPDQAIVRAGLYGAVKDAFAAARIVWDDCHHEDRGDGVLVLVHPDVPKSALATTFLAELAEALTRHNRAHGPSARIRLRVALHAGEVRHDPHGVVGSAINFAFRLLNAGAVKSALRRSAGVLAVVASGWFYDEVIRHEPAAVPAEYNAVRVSVKQARARAWVYAPDRPGGHGGADHDTTWQGTRAAPAAANVPRQLLAPVGDFVGRDDALATLAGLVGEPSGRAPAVVVAVIAGPAGVGKTALVMHWAHQFRRHFPDGELYINLRGADPGPAVPPEEALDWMLRALDVDAEKIPAGVEAKAAAYRSLLDGRRMLVVLDNAANVEQARSLMPGTPGCVVMVTSRGLLSGFIARDGAHRIRLDRLTKAEAVDLLRQIIGATQVDAEPAAALTIALRCDCLPLALRVAAQRVVTRRHASLAQVADDLCDERSRLDMLDTDDEYTGVRTAFSWSYRALPAPDARTFRLLGLHRGPDISLDVVAALTGTTTAAARRSLELLTSQHLVEETAPDRYRLHDLLRCYAEERAHAEETEQDVSHAVRCMLVWYLQAADDARGNFLPHHFTVALTAGVAPARRGTFTGYGEAQRWCEMERINLIAAIHHAADAGHHDIAWRLTVALTAFFYLRKYPADWTATHEVGLASARHLGDRVGEASVLMGLGFAFQDHRFEESMGYFRQALDIFRATNDRSGQAWAILGIGHVSRGLRRFEESIEHYSEALDVFGEMGVRLGRSLAFLGLGYAFGGLQRFELSIECFRSALEFVDDDQRTEGWALHGLGYGYRGLGRVPESIDHCERALLVFAKIGDWRGQGEAMYNLGKAQADAGRHELARQYWTQALAIFHDLNDDRESDVRARLDEHEPDVRAGAATAGTARAGGVSVLPRGGNARDRSGGGD